MIVELTIKCVGGCYLEEECIKVVEFNLEESLSVLQRCILDSVGFDCDHLSSFFVGKTPNPYNQSNIASYQGDMDDFYDVDEDDNDETYETTLDTIYPLPPKYKLYYLFDFGDSWIFSIIKGRKQPHSPVEGVRYPRIIKEVGVNPEQYPDCEE